MRVTSLLGAIALFLTTSGTLSADIVATKLIEDFSSSAPAGVQDTGVLNTSAGIGAAEFFSSVAGSPADNATGTSFTVNSTSYSFVITSGKHDTASGVATSIAGLDTPGDEFVFEADINVGNGTGQGDADSDAFGFDDGGNSAPTSQNQYLLLDFTASANAVRYFAADLLDFEGGNSRDAYVAVYDTNGDLVESSAFSFAGDSTAGSGHNGFGDDVVRNFAVSNVGQIGYVAFYVGDDNGGDGGNEHLAIADFYAASIPEPTGILAIGMIGVVVVARRRRKSS